MSYINSSRAVYVYINDVDVSQYLLEGSLSDDSAYTNNIITTTGEIILGTDNAVLDFNRTTWPIGSKINIWVQLDNGEVALHPKGTLYLINSNVNVEERRLTLTVGCSLAFLADKEDSYESAIEDLVDDMITAEAAELYIIEKKDLETLSNLLEAEGSVIYQDPYGNIQKLPAFGTDGLGANIAGSKLTSFDNYSAISIESISESAIEPNVSAVTVEASVDVPGGLDGDSESPTPEPLITSSTTRTVDAPFVTYTYTVGKAPAYIEQDTGSEVQSEYNPNCGSPTDATATPSGIGYSFKAFGSLDITTTSVTETVTNGRYVEYEGPGKQVSLEQTWERCSAATWAASALSRTMSQYSNFVNESISEANGLLSKANQHFDARDDQPYSIDGEINPKYIFHNCNGNTFYQQAESIVETAANWTRLALNLNGGYSKYALSNRTTTVYTYGTGGELLKTVTTNEQHELSFDGSEAYETSLSVYGEQSSTGYTSYAPFNAPTVFSAGGGGLRTASVSVKTYIYSNLYTTEIEDFTDYQNPKNSYVRTNYSASGSTNAEQPDRLIEATNANGQKFCNDNTTQKELVATVPVIPANTSISTSWFGDAKAYEKKVSFPMEFIPAVPTYDEATDTCTPVDTAGLISRFESVLKRYAINLAKKITGDNRGFRVTEKLRAEIFQYYPFYPVTLSLSSLSRAFTSRVAAASWVFDSENAICSFDCLISGDIDDPVFADPDSQSVYIKTESTETLTTSLLGVPETAATISVLSLPEDGTLELSGSPVSVNDVIDVADITASSFSFTPTAAGTAAIAFSFTSADSSAETISSKDYIYPLLTSTLVTVSNYAADGGEFTLNVSNNGFDCDGGDFDLTVTNGGLPYMEAGDFDTGLTVSIPAPALSSGVPSGNASIDPEAEYGIYVKDLSDNQISVSTLPTSNGDLAAVFDISVNVAIEPDVFISLAFALIDQLGWDYQFIAAGGGNEIDMGSFADPNEYALDFGSFTTPLEPVLASSVV